MPINGACQHLLINHVPIVLTLLGTLAVILALITTKRAIWIYALATLTLSGLSVYPVMRTGHAAERVVKQKIPTINKGLIHDHEEAGELATWVVLATGAAAALAWWRLSRARELPMLVQILLLFMTLGAAGTIGYTAYEGGMIIHTESRS